MDNKYKEYVKEHFQTGVEYGQNLFSTTHAAGNEMAQKVTDMMASNLELGKSFLNCKSFEDMVNWGESLVQSNLDHCVKTGSSVYSKACSEVNKANSAVAKKVGECVSKMKHKFHDE